MAEKNPKDANTTELWVSRVCDYSSEYDPVNWAANCVIGTPKVYPRYGDIHGAWAQGVCDSQQFLEVGFAEKLYLDEVHIYETYHAGSVHCIKAKNPDNTWVVIWTGQTQNIRKSRIFKPDIVKKPFLTDELRIETDCSTSSSWAEIDAVMIVGRRYDFLKPLPETGLSDALGNLVNNSKFSDVQFQVEKETFYAHRAILVVRSDFFDAILTREFKEKRSKEPIVFQDVSPESFRVMLYFIYTNKIPANCSCILLTDVWRVGDRFKLDGLQALAVRAIASKLDINNVVDIYMAAIYKLPVIDDLRTVCTDFMRRNMTEVVRTESFMTLHQENVIELIQMMTTKLNI
ncbi:speckle-type POZ protein-like [Ylistrum balloti]|uniref:speckle-type POZ protein-like n=1 Tax=Ylistrum balloti TaxID=509963 RepID=UPI002905CB65|nr:speckle-type POZ protein-like [Ylistrum balloti]